MRKTYFIDPSYNHRNEEPLETNPAHKNTNSERFQKEVYQKARQIADENNWKKILDIGTGSAFKLLKYFDSFETLGTDVPATVKWLNEKYPNKKWTSNIEPKQGYDLIICADVIEHIVDPDNLLDMIENCNAKHIIISTVARNLGGSQSGPPDNLHHCREWAEQEFANYIGSRFTIKEHYISNHRQRTQVVIAQNK